MIERIKEIQKNIEKAAKKRGKSLEDITLVAVSKTFPIEKIVEGYKFGLKIFGESRLQEARDKIDRLMDLEDIKFHLIGHIQTNKIKLIKDSFSLIQTVDSINLADKLDNYFRSFNHRQDILIQVNLVNEPQKYGIKIEELPKLLEFIKDKKFLNLRGFMFIPPYYENPELNRENYRKMFKLFDNIKNRYTHFNVFDTLSMGMSDDYEIAIEEGSTMVRIGSAIFGRR
ncbi:MAG: YggS family pyridoxal phosphate-dependent enzyme [Deferribacterales bacterium]